MHEALWEWSGRDAEQAGERGVRGGAVPRGCASGEGLARAQTFWYWGGLTVNEAKEKLRETSEGTFLIRDSAHPDYLLTISVKTSTGPIKLRIEYQDGKFRLDCIVCVKSKLKQLRRSRPPAPPSPLAGSVHLHLAKPLYTSAPPRQHLCRRTINKCTHAVWALPLPRTLKDDLGEYKFQV